jgi:hypothetical protein
LVSILLAAVVDLASVEDDVIVIAATVISIFILLGIEKLGLGEETGVRMSASVKEVLQTEVIRKPTPGEREGRARRERDPNPELVVFPA